MFIEVVLQMNWAFPQMNNFWFCVWPFDLIYRLKHVLVPGTSAYRIYVQDLQQIDHHTSSNQCKEAI
jgi:hypothetical protein